LWTPRLSEKGLYALSLISISLLLLAPEPGPTIVEDLSGVSGVEGHVRMLCAVTGIRETDDGWLLDLMDCGSRPFGGYCSYDLLEIPPVSGTTIWVTGDLVWEPEPFVFIDDIYPAQ
jgi:hypothetical protein